MPIYKGKPTKDGRMYYFRAYKIDGSQFESKKYATRKEAVDEEAIFRLKKDSPIHKRFDLFAKDYLNNLLDSRKESTWYSYESIYRTHLEPYFGTKDILSINIPMIDNWMREMSKKGLKTKYLQKIFMVLDCIFKYAKKYGVNNPLDAIENFQSPKDEVIENKIRYITKDEFDRFVSVIDDIEWYTFFYFLYYTGMRKGEVQALNWSDIKGDKIIVNKTLTTKTNNKEGFKITSTKNNLNRTITMNKSLIEVMNKYKKYMMSFDDFKESWYVFGGGRWLPQITIDRKKHYYFEKSGVKEITIHEFRHSNVSMLVNEYLKTGQTDTAKFFIMMSQRLGHSIDVMQRTYLHLFPSVQNEIVDILDRM